MSARSKQLARPAAVAGFGSTPARLAWTLGSLLALVAVWELAAVLVASNRFPGPVAVGEALMREFASGALVRHVGATLARVVVSFVIAMLIGAAIGLALGMSRAVDRFFDPWLIFFLNLPALVVIILCYVWFGLTELAAVTAVAINKIPNVAVTVREGARSLSKDLAEMAAVYRFGPWKTMRHVTLPQLAPFFAAAARGGLSLVWKIVLVVELLGRSNGVGHQLNVAFQLFDVSMIIAYAVAFILVVQAIEFGILQPLEARVGKWRR
jgi:NitT/TauT family transport system permease protein